MDAYNKRIRLYGAGGHSQVIKDVADIIGYDIVEVFDDQPSNINYWEPGKTQPGLRINHDFPYDGDSFVIAIGDNRTRALLAKKLKSSFETIIHPLAIVSKETTIGTGTVIYAGAVIQPNTCIGKHVIINTSASVDYENVIGDFVHISPKVALDGHVEVGKGSFVGAGAVVIPKIKIGKWCVIGAGTVVIKDVPDYAIVVGNPGKIIKYQKPI